MNNTIRLHNYIGCLVLCMITLVSCSDFLNEPNPNTITVNDFWKTESDFESGVMATYNTLGQGEVLGINGATLGHLMSETTISNPWVADAIDLNNFRVSNINRLVVNKWDQLYRGIFRANQVLEHLNNVDLSPGFEVGIEAEARFLRGLYYFWLASNYNKGSIPIHISVPASENDYHKPLSSKEEVYALIFEDLKFAQANLPQSWNTDNLGRATWGAATGILGQVYLYEKDYVQAGAEFKKIIDRDIYKLTPDISWNFDLEHEHNSESIFEVNFSDAVKQGESSHHATGRARNVAPQEAGGERGIEPSYYFIELCKTDPIDPSMAINSGQTYSRRALATICFKGDGQVFYQRPSSDYPFIVNQEAHIKKFQNWTWREEPNTQRSGINERILRLADVYLMYAETVLKTTGNVDEAIEYVNLVRERSAVLKLNRADYNADRLLTHLMRVERPLELAFEGHMTRWQDLKRWGIVKEVFTEVSAIRYRSLSDWLRVATPADLAEPGADIRQQYVEAARNYTTELDYFPIPNVELITNSELSEN